MFKSLLIANRGEIACRIAQTCKQLGIRSIAVYSDADAQAPHVRLCDDAVYIGDSESKASYLNIEAILEAAKDSGAEAIHPGYGFLSENAAFAEAVEKAKIRFIGPSPKTITQMGDKIQAKELAKSVHVPTVPGVTIKDPQKIDGKSIVKELGLPLLIKAAGGGGGRGMRIVRSEEEFSDAIMSASREAMSFFGNSEVFIEKLVEGARHIEVQIMGCSSGHVMHFGTRDCTMQRNHQKVIEEAPASLISDALRERLHQSAVDICKAAGYQNAGTVEFLVKGDDFYFLEVNSRLQVEHPVTEAIYGIDLVEIQLRVATGETLDKIVKQSIIPVGHAIQARICSESPRRDFQADTGMIVDWKMPVQNVRVDSGCAEGTIISHYYDSLIAKLIVHRHTRESAISATRSALADTVITGVETNIEFLQALLGDQSFIEGVHHTKTAHTILESMKQDPTSTLPLIAHAIIQQNNASLSYDGFRIHGTQGQKYSAVINGDTFTRTLVFLPDNTIYSMEDDQVIQYEKRLSAVILTINDQRCLFNIFPAGKTIWLTGSLGVFSVTPSFPKLRAGQAIGGSDTIEIKCPLPGKILTVGVKKGDSLKEGATLAVIESMKMEHSISSPGAYTVDEVNAVSGSSVQRDAILFVLKRIV